MTVPGPPGGGLPGVGVNLAASAVIHPGGPVAPGGGPAVRYL